MDAVIQALIKGGGGYIAAALMVMVLGVTLKAARILLEREWARNDRLDGQVEILARNSEKLVETGQKMLEGQKDLARDLDNLLDRPRRR